MKVTVVGNFLNVRAGAPSLNAPASNYLSPGEVIEVTDTIHKGDSYNGTDDWHGDEADNFYWRGGTSSAVADGTVFYNSFLKEFDQKILSTQGAGTTVIVIDEGIVQDGNFFDLSKMKAIELDPDPITNDHANFIGGILAGKATVFGLVPKAQLISLKYKSDRLEPAQFLQNLITALQVALDNQGPTIVNLSQAFSADTLEGCSKQQSQITKLIQQISAAPNKFLICSASDNSTINDQLFPSAMKECISVGTIDSDHTDMEVTVPLDILSPMATYRSFGLNFTLAEKMGSSFVTAVITALSSCIIAGRLPLLTKKADLITALKNSAVNRSSFQYDTLKSFQIQIT